MCEDDPVLREWYSIDENKTEILDIVKWYPEKQQIGFPAAIDLLTNLSLYERRNNLKGKVLRAVIVKNSLLFSMKNNKMQGYFSLAITELENALNFTLNIVAEKREFGSYNTTTKRWSGAFSLVASGEADIGISDFSMTNIRLNFVDYTIPIITTKRCLFLKQPEMFTVKWFAYYKVYNFMLWISLIVTMIISLFVLAFIRSRIESNNMIQEIFHEFIRIWGIFCQQGISGELPRNLSLKLAYFTVLMTALVIFTAYSASMISFVTACIRNVPFHTVEEFIDDSSYSLIMLKGSSDYDMFIYSKDSASKYMMSKMLPIDKLPIDVESGFQIICDNSKIGYYSGYTKRIQKITQSWRIPCEVYCIDIGPIDSLSLILSKDNQFTSIINYYLQKLLNSGILNRFKNEESFVEESKFEPVAIYSVASIIIIFFGGALLALVILFIEIYYKKLKSKSL
ncbi:glutamate receptor 1-like isoform X3 [Apis cerana]|nr:glutamate receptor 1-like isoform X3 [Apis cerana]